MTGLNIDDLGLPDYQPEQPVQGVEDAFDYPVAYKFAFVGVGQAGGRIAQTFYDLGYRRVCAVNTAQTDLSELSDLPATSKLAMGEQQGVGKDPATAAKIAASRGEDIYDLLTRTCDGADRIFVCLSGAGGTGAGAFAQVAAVANNYMISHRKPGSVGAIIALPKDSEGPRGAKNVLYTVNALSKLKLSPIIFIDNERFKQLYGSRLPAQREKPESNSSTAKLLHTFNRLAGTESDDVGGTTFDAADFGKLLGSGVVAFASAGLTKWDSPTQISEAIRDRLRNNVLAAVDLSKGSIAGLIYIVAGEAWDGDNAVTVEYLDHGTDMMNRIMDKPDSVVFTGVYPTAGATGSIQVLSMIGGLPYPQARLEDLAKRAGIPKDNIAAFLGMA